MPAPTSSQADSAQPWHVDFDWLWGSSLPDPVATLRVTVCHGDALRLRQDFLNTLHRDAEGVAGAGGWAAYDREIRDEGVWVVDLVSGGEDVADALQDAASRLYEAVADTPGVQLTWKQLPLRNADEIFF